MEETMRHRYAIGILLAALACIGSAQLSAQDNGPGNQIVLLIPDGKTVYDTVNHVTWLADATWLPPKNSDSALICAAALPSTLRECRRFHELRVRHRMGRGYECPELPGPFQLATPHHSGQGL
jgi:hypothetical protein